MQAAEPVQPNKPAAPDRPAPSFAGKRIVILGLARQGLALARFFTQAGARVTVSDAAGEERLAQEAAAARSLGVGLALGGHPLALLDGCDLLCLSGGVPPQIEIVRAAVARGIPLSNDSLLTLQEARRRGLGPIVAITGSSGKTTTTTLVGLMLAAAGRNVHVGGNIGTPLLDRLDSIRPGEPLVLELSSFQLELVDPAVAFGDLEGIGPDVGAILNVTPNHLDRHPSLAAYAAAKFNLFRHLPAGAAVVVSADDAVTGQFLASVEATPATEALPPGWDMEPVLAAAAQAVLRSRAALVAFSHGKRLRAGAWLEGDTLVYAGEPICRRQEMQLRGEHNVSNMLAAAAISGAAGATAGSMADVARAFPGVPHRLEQVAETGGVTWINDSIATSPERAIAGLRSFDPQEHMLILLAGGKDKNLPWDAWADEVIERVTFLIGFGQAGPMVVEKVREHAGFDRRKAPATAVVHRLDEAVELAARSAHAGAIVLLSPGGTSYDAYKDFEARGEHFRELVQQFGELCLRREA
jgi:UDP-N-acetylmuramoylalanine--D-glutamate ligase